MTNMQPSEIGGKVLSAKEIEVNDLKPQIKDLLIKVKNVGSYNEFLVFIIKNYFYDNKNGGVINKFAEHFSKIFKLNVQSFLHYLSLDFKVDLVDLDLSKAEYNAVNEFLHSIKLMYGPIILAEFNKNQDPFSLAGAEFNVIHNESTHKLTFKRNDGNFLDVNFRAHTLLPLTILLNQALHQSISNGLFNLNEDMVNDYIKANQEIILLLNDILSSKKDA